MSDLRTAIAQVLQPRLLSDMRWPDTSIATRNAEELADAVIAALDLRIDDKHRSASGEQQYVGVSGFFAVKGETDDE
jgi:hypothetical protein